jgi:hypothetical protein
MILTSETIAGDGAYLIHKNEEEEEKLRNFTFYNTNENVNVLQFVL